MIGWEGLFVCELSSSAAVTLNFTPNHTWLSGFPSILPGLSGVSGKRGTRASISPLSAQHPCPPPPTLGSFLLFTLGPELGG